MSQIGTFITIPAAAADEVSAAAVVRKQGWLGKPKIMLWEAFENVTTSEHVFGYSGYVVVVLLAYLNEECPEIAPAATPGKIAGKLRDHTKSLWLEFDTFEAARFSGRLNSLQPTDERLRSYILEFTGSPDEEQSPLLWVARDWLRTCLAGVAEGQLGLLHVG